MTGIVATAEITVGAPQETVWAALTDPALIKQYMFGAAVETSWVPGSRITWSGEYSGQRYQDRGEVITVDPPRRLAVTHFSPLSGADDMPENYHRLTYTLTAVERGTHIELTQDNNSTEDAAEHAATNWMSMLQALKQLVEGTAGDARAHAGQSGMRLSGHRDVKREKL